VVNLVGRNRNAVAEQAVGLMLAEARDLARADAGIKAGAWPEETTGPVVELHGRTVGLVGLARSNAASARSNAGSPSASRLEHLGRALPGTVEKRVALAWARSTWIRPGLPRRGPFPRWQDSVTPPWSRLWPFPPQTATPAAIEAAGIGFERIERFDPFPPCFDGARG
jgi:hypothetical protein